MGIGKERPIHGAETMLRWSDEDRAFVAEVPELPGCMAHGDTREAALRQAGDAVRLQIDAAREFGDPVPPPRGRRPVRG